MSGNDGAALVMHLPAKVGHAYALGKRVGILHAVHQKVSLLGRDLDAGKDNQTWSSCPQFLQFCFGPEPIMLGNHHAVESDSACLADKSEWIHLAIGRIAQRMH